MTKNISTLVFLLMMFASNFIFAQSWQWASNLPDTSKQNLPGKIVADNLGNSYIVGSFQGKLNFSATLSIVSTGNYDIYLAKYNSEGQVVWAKGYGGINDDRGTCIALDSNQNVIIGGSFIGTAYFGTTTLQNYNPNGQSMFVVKLNSFGNITLAKAIGGYDASSLATLNGICTDSIGNIFGTGLARSYPLIFGNGVEQNVGGNSVGFVIFKLDSIGTVQWVKQGGSVGQSYGLEIKLSPNQENIIACGSFGGPKFIYENDTVFSAANPSFYLCSFFMNLFAQTGSTNFIQGITSLSGSVEISSLAFDHNSNIYLSGYCQHYILTEPLTAFTGMFSPRKIFLLKYNPSGNFIASTAIGSNAEHRAYSLTTNYKNKILLSGSCDAGLESDTIVAWLQNGNQNAGFVAEFDTNIVCNKIFYGAKGFGMESYFTSTYIDKYDNVYVHGAADSNPIFDSITYLCEGRELFLAKYGPSCALQFLTQPINQNTYASENVYLVATASESTASYQWQVNDGNGYVNIVNIGQYSGANNDTLYINHINLMQNNYLYRCLVNYNGCTEISNDAIFTVNCVNNILTQPTDLNIAVNNDAVFFVSTTNANASFQWQMNFGNGFVNVVDTSNYSGSNNDTLFINNTSLFQNNIAYRCIISADGCIDTSLVVTLTVSNFTSIDNIEEQPITQVYYNSMDEILNIQMNYTLNNAVIEIYNAIGQKIMSKNINQLQTKINLQNLMTGFYSLVISVNNETISVQKIIKSN